MSEYTLNWTSKPTSITVPDLYVNTDSTDLKLYGRGARNYGEGIQENLLHLLENFASDVPPSTPTIGQMWYNTVDSSTYVEGLNVYTNAGWHSIDSYATTSYAPINSPNFTGLPTAPTPPLGDNSQRLATTAFIRSQNYLTSIPTASSSVSGAVKVGPSLSISGGTLDTNKQHFFDNNFLNFEPKIGKGNDPYVVVNSNFKASWIESNGVIIVNEYDQECCYYIAGDGKSQVDMFKAFKITTESTWTFAPEPVRPAFLLSTEFITALYKGSEDYLFGRIYNSATNSSRQVLIRTNGVDNPVMWTVSNVLVALSANATFLLDQDRIVEIVPSGNNFNLAIYKISDGTQVGSTRTIFNFINDIDYSHATRVFTSRSVRTFTALFNPITNNLIILFHIIGYYTDGTSSAYTIAGVTLSYDVPDSVIQTDTGTVTSLVTNGNFFSLAALYDGSAIIPNFAISHHKATNTIYYTWKNGWSSAYIGWTRKTVLGQFTSRGDFITASYTIYAPDSSPWSKNVTALRLFSNGTCVFTGISNLYGTRTLVAQYTIEGNEVKIIPGRWRMTGAKPAQAPADVLDNAVPSQFSTFTNQVRTCTTFDADDNPLYLYCDPTVSLNIYQVVIDPVTLLVSFSLYQPSSILPALLATYTMTGGWAYDPKRSIFYFVVRKTGEYNSHRVLALHNNMVYESEKFNETYANSSRTAIYGTTVGVNATVSSSSNILVDKNGDVYVNQAYGVVGGAISTPYNRLTFDGTAFTIEASATTVIAHEGSYITSYSAEGYSGKRSATGVTRNYILTSDALSARTAFITAPDNDLYIWVTGSTGLTAFIASQDIFVAGQWTKLLPTSVLLQPNATNYIYVRRSSSDVSVLEPFVTTTFSANSFSRVLIAAVVTDAANPISQTNYIVNETTAKWKNILDRPDLTLDGVLSGTASFTNDNIILNASFSQAGLDAIGSGGSGYTLPVATAAVLGGIKVGSGLTMTGDVLSNSAPNVNYTLPVATGSVLGGVKVGSGLAMTGDVLSNSAPNVNYTLPVATASVLGGVKVGSGLAMTGDVLSAPASALTLVHTFTTPSFTSAAPHIFDIPMTAFGSTKIPMYTVDLNWWVYENYTSGTFGFNVNVAMYKPDLATASSLRITVTNTGVSTTWPDKLTFKFYY